MIDKTRLVDCLVAVLMLVFVASIGVVAAETETFDGTIRAESSVVLIKIDTNQVSISDIVNTSQIRYDYGSLVPGLYAIYVPSGYSEMDVISYYSQIPGVISVEADGTSFLVDDTTFVSDQSVQSPFPVAGILTGLAICSLWRILVKRI